MEERNFASEMIKDVDNQKWQIAIYVKNDLAQYSCLSILMDKKLDANGQSGLLVLC